MNNEYVVGVDPHRKDDEPGSMIILKGRTGRLMFGIRRNLSKEEMERQLQIVAMYYGTQVWPENTENQQHE